MKKSLSQNKGNQAALAYLVTSKLNESDTKTEDVFNPAVIRRVLSAFIISRGPEGATENEIYKLAHQIRASLFDAFKVCETCKLSNGKHVAQTLTALPL